MKFKNTYLLLISIIGLVSLAMYTTYAMFTASLDIGGFVDLTASNLPTDTSVIEYERLTLNTGESKTIDLNIINSTSSNLYYGVWYEMVEPSIINDNIIIAKHSNSASNTIGELASSVSSTVTLILVNNTTDSITINIGVGYSKTSSLKLPTTRELISETYGNFKVDMEVNNASIQGGVTLNNLITNGSFENGTNSWNLSDASVTTSNSSHGNSSLLLSSGVTAMSTQTLSKSSPTLNHHYYGRLKFLSTSNFTTLDNRYEWYHTDAGNALMVFANKNIATTDWTLMSNVSSITDSTYLSNSWHLRNFQVGANANSYVDELMIIDLTESFGSGNEPSKEWLDSNLSYFDGTKSIKSDEVLMNGSVTYTIILNNREIDNVVCDNTSDITISGNVITINNITSDTKCSCSTKVSNLDTSDANTPELVDGLIPVMYNGSNWVKTSNKNDNETYPWYNYDNKQWANAVLVRSTNRSTYQNATPGTVIPESDVLAYYVWIPRYKYKVWNKNKIIGTDSYNAYTTGIDIIFEKGIETTGDIKCTNYSFAQASDNSLNETCSGSNGGYYTHPAFTFGDKELEGIWVGKFEVSSSAPNATNGGDVSTSLEVRIKPNINSWRGNQLNNFHVVIQNMQKSSNQFGLTTDRAKVDSHVIKTMEWGCVAYFTNSKYGRCSNNSCSELTINTSDSYITGGGNYVSNVGQSTTGNIYGIYDMSGGTWEYTMGNMSSITGSYKYYPFQAGDNFNYSTATAKYINTYAYGSGSYDQKAMNSTRLGDAVGEIMLTSSDSGGWYEDFASFPSTGDPWFRRGGRFNSEIKAGIFNFCRNDGSAAYDVSTRAILVSLE